MDHDVVIDTLHLFLRIADVLIENLIQELRVLDTIDKKSLFKSGIFCRSTYAHMTKYEGLLQNLGIRFRWFVNKDTHRLEYRDLTGPEKLLLFRKIKLVDLVGDNSTGWGMQKLWDDFSLLIVKLKLDFIDPAEVDLFSNEIKMWVTQYYSLYTAASVTPYMHAFAQHVPEFLKLYGNINLFNQQGLEKYNDQCSRDYFRSTNHKSLEALRQMMLKKNRMQLLDAMGAGRLKRSYLCSNCHENRHTIKTCVAKCNNCQYHTCCGHLVKMFGKWTRNCEVD